jgi:CubicO group peptidase (beta-lactamase class C family)
MICLGFAMTKIATSLGFDPDRLARIGTFFEERYIASKLLPCAQVTVLRHGEVAWSSTHGMADPERGRPLTDDAIFRIYSMTKPVTSIAFMMLVEEGLVGLDDPVHRFIPSWRGLEVMTGGELGAFTTEKTKAPMRMVDLLRHTSGLSYGLQEGALSEAYRQARFGAADGPDLPGLIDKLATLPLAFSPGEAWNYSVSTDVLGYLVGLISGVPFETFIEERIFQPLGMVDTGFHVHEGQGHRFTACYAMTPKGEQVLQDDAETSRYHAPAHFISGGGGLVSTSHDYSRFCQMLLNKGELGGVRLVAPKTLELMAANHLPGGKDLTELSISLFSESAYSGTGFGLGFAVTMDPMKTLIPGSPGEYFWGGMASTAFWIDPIEDLACIFMTQVIPSNAYPIRRQLRTLVYSALVEPTLRRP